MRMDKNIARHFARANKDRTREIDARGAESSEAMQQARAVAAAHGMTRRMARKLARRIPRA